METLIQMLAASRNVKEGYRTKDMAQLCLENKNYNEIQ